LSKRNDDGEARPHGLRQSEEVDMRLLRTFIIAILAIIAVPAFAAGYPERNIMVIVPFPPGGGSDTVARLVVPKASELLHQTMIIDNRGGANGAIGSTSLKTMAPDGYSVLFASIGVYAINPALFKDLKYDPLKDFDLLSIAVRTPNVLVINPQFPVKSVPELIAYLKANPGKVTFASSGVGSSDHLTAALFWQLTDTTGIHVPYKGGGPAVNDLIGGHASVSFQNVGTVAQQIRAGTLKALAVTGATRNAAFPDIPTAKELGIAGLEVYSFQAAAAPKGLPAEVRAKLEEAFIAAAKSPDIRARLEELGYEIVANNGAEFTQFLTGEVARWKDVVEKGKITAQQ
jgi:tripartite-type tricarboxylate transporter receptor subunit TctC